MWCVLLQQLTVLGSSCTARHNLLLQALSKTWSFWQVRAAVAAACYTCCKSDPTLQALLRRTGKLAQAQWQHSRAT